MIHFRRALTLFAVIAVVLIALVAWVFGQEKSFVSLENRGVAPVHLAVTTTNRGEFSWAGRLEPGARVLRIARFADNSFVIVCTDDTGPHRGGGGYVTNGPPQIVRITATGCAAVTVDIQMLP